MAKFMRTIRDAREDLSGEIRSTSSILSDDYTSGNIRDIERDLSNRMTDEEILENDIDISEEERRKNLRGQ